MTPPFPQFKSRFLRVILILFGVIVLTTVVILMVGILWVVWGIGTGSWEGDRAPRPEPSEPSWPTPPRWAPDGGEIIFAHRGAIYAVDSNGSTLKSIHGGGRDKFGYGAPALSPDGSRMAYVKYWSQRVARGTSYKLEIATSEQDGSDEAILTDVKGHYTNLTWSPNGNHVAFTRSLSIHTLSLDDSEYRTIGRGEDVDRSPNYVGVDDNGPSVAWSPDGGRIAFVGLQNWRGAGTTRSVYTMATDGSGRVKIMDHARMPAWSPAGERIAFVREDRGVHETAGELTSLHTMLADGSDPREVGIPPSGMSLYRAGSWSPDGTHILFGAVVAKADGSGLLVLPRPDSGAPGAQGQFWDLLPNAYSRTSWSPDGSRIAVQSAHVSAISVLYTVDRNGADSRVLVVRGEDGSLSAAGGWPLQEGQAGRQYVRPNRGQGP